MLDQAIHEGVVAAGYVPQHALHLVELSLDQPIQAPQFSGSVGDLAGRRLHQCIPIDATTGRGFTCHWRTKRPLRPPDFSSRRTCWTTISRSTDLHMS